MTRDEHRDIIAFIDSALQQEQALDVEAEAIIRALFVRNPEAAYRITMLAMAQAKDLAEVKSELAEERRSFRSNWLSRLLKKQDTMQRNGRRDPRLSMYPQNVRGR